jgi:hypothetical protein
MNPKYPVYIVSKGRWESRLTSKAFETMKVPYYIIVEEQEYDKYAEVIDPNKILILPKSYQEEYDTCDDLGNTKSKGPGAARNYAWEHSMTIGADWHWVCDDNIGSFKRLNRNKKSVVMSGTIFRIMEDFVERYTNVAIAGPNYIFFAPATEPVPAFRLNTRIYSVLLIRNDIPYRWRGRYNEDTDLSLRALKDGWCTVLFNAFLQNKSTTQKVKGGCNADFYQVEGTSPKSEMQVKLHPDVSKVVYRFHRIHHYVDYTPFKNNKLIRKGGIAIPELPNDYGMKLIDFGVKNKPIWKSPEPVKEMEPA